jgi:predicted GNAT superfamily acetyltransferase
MSESIGSGPARALLDPAALGFRGNEEIGWLRSTRGRQAHFRLLRTLADLTHAERLQEEVFGVSERDLIPANELIVVPETGGAVLAVFLPEDPDRAVGVLVGWGGFVGRPRVVSDFLAIRSEVRNLGLASELKRLQAAIAVSRGFAEIVWTVDPLRAANARLNFGKLGATAHRYEIDRYGATFATTLYGGLPTDRLHITWDILSPRVISRLHGQEEPQHPAEIRHPAPFMPGMSDDTALVAIPADIDALLAARPDQALTWRRRIRETLCQAFAAGFVITGFHPALGDSDPAYLLERRPASND